MIGILKRLNGKFSGFEGGLSFRVSYGLSASAFCGRRSLSEEEKRVSSIWKNV